MQKNKSFLVWLTTILVVGLTIPVAFAANSKVENITITPDPFYTQIPGHEAKLKLDYEWNSGGHPDGKITEQIKDSSGNIVYYFGASQVENTRTANSPGNNEPINLEWNGKGNTGSYNGQYVPDGTYTFYVFSKVDTPPDVTKTKEFNVKKAALPDLQWVSVPNAHYYSGSGDYKTNFDLKLNSASTANVKLKIVGPENNNPQEEIVSAIKNSSGKYTLAWDGKIGGVNAEAGKYNYTLVAEGKISGFDVLSNELTGSFNLSTGTAPNPVISNVTANPANFNPHNEQITFGYTLGSSTGNTTINASVFKSNDTSVAVKAWTFNNQSSGNNTIIWNGITKDMIKAEDGSYIFKVEGSDGSFSLVPVQTSFVVTNSTQNSGEKCAGFTDVSKNDADCEAFTYVKGLGAMTGNPDGTLAPNDLLQRDQVAKIILETFNKFDSSSNYCSGNPFPDVTSVDWSYQYICRGVGLGMITGYKAGADAGYYRPSRSVNRVEFLALLLRNVSDSMPSNNSASYSDVELGQWFTGYAKYAKDNNLFSGSKLFPTASTTRREVAQTIYKLHQLGKI